jgi:hypothetical protein
MNNINIKNIKKFNCDFCSYHTDKPSEWLRHSKSQRHQRMGQKKTFNCTQCDYECKTPWNLKMHVITQHVTKEERSKQKYYCSICDIAFFSPLYRDKHMNGIKHLTNKKALDDLQNFNEINIKTLKQLKNKKKFN